MDDINEHIKLIDCEGIIRFDPKDKTKKHTRQSDWKSVAMIEVNCDLYKYYSWFLFKRYNLELNKPLRGTHVTFVSDRIKDKKLYERVKKKYDGRKIKFKYKNDPRTNGDHWWIRVECDEAKDIREEIGLSRKSYFGLHLTLGYPNEKMKDHSFYIWSLFKNDLLNLE